MTRTFFIWDVHGCYDELMALVEKIWLQDEDCLYFVWDLINKWPKSREVVEYVSTRPNTWSVQGNHEYFSMIDVDTIIGSPHLSDGHKRWIREMVPEYAKSWWKWLEKYKDYITSLPHMIERDDFIVVHGGIHPDLWLDTPPEIATLIRMHEGRPWYEYYNGTKPIIYGHWAVDGLRIRANTIGIDTGCCFGWHLTAYCLETKEIYQVRANQVYAKPGHWA